jgi:hypothetical protein
MMLYFVATMLFFLPGLPELLWHSELFLPAGGIWSGFHN